MKQRLERLQREFPYPDHWGRLQMLESQVVFDEGAPTPAGIHHVGVWFENDQEPHRVGSAATLLGAEPQCEALIDRAYFEALERGYWLDFETAALQDPEQQGLLLDHQGHALGSTSWKNWAPRPPPRDALWRASKSNGLAIHTHLQQAIDNAGFELLERDRLLRFWFAGKQPLLIDIEPEALPRALLPHYEIQAYLFDLGHDRAQGLAVVGVFGFPREARRPLLLGFGAGPTPTAATQKALKEIYQRYAALWEEPLLQELPPLAPTPLYHLDYYHCPLSWPYLRKWLDGSLRERDLDLQPPQWSDLSFVQWARIPTAQGGDLFLVKATAANAFELTFGGGHPKLPPSFGPELPAHPIA